MELNNLKEYIQKDILSFWLNNALDEENGGIFTQIGEKGDVYGQEKNVWFIGRALWTFSYAYRLLGNIEYLETAKNLYEHLLTVYHKGEPMGFITTADYKPVQPQGFLFTELFAAAGCAEYYNASNDPSSVRLADELFDTVWVLYTKPQSRYKIGDVEFKELAHSMILLNIASTILSTRVFNAKYSDICRRCCDEIMHGGYINDELGVVLEKVTLAGEFYNSPDSREVNPGHDLECAWFLMSVGKTIGYNDACLCGKHIVDMMMPKGIDKEHGGIVAFIDALGAPSQKLEWDMKIWWPQCEAIIANAIAYEQFGEQKYLDAFNTMFDYVFKYFADGVNGEWYGYLHYDNTLANTLKGNISKGPFHLPRMLMMIYELKEVLS